MANPWGALLVYAGLVFAVGIGMITLTTVITSLLGTRRVNPDKLDAYECGVPSFTEGARGRFPVKFYLVAILFILFDVETVFLLPWAAEYGWLGPAAFIEVVIFIGLLVVGYVYVLRRGALDWEN
ncbi:MAG: NADH-quinone oxidoreductase subunit A [Planctomycetota bacterium]|jgi:NADH-quinone oxidoreductase subunit A